MFYYLKTTLRERWPLFLIVLIILSTIGVGYMGAQSVSDRIVIQAKTDLEKNWRFPYDLLVLPKQQTEKSILLDGLVPSHSTLASYGGISTEDLVKIKAISGVEIAAPLSLIGYIPTAVVSVSYGEAEQGAFYMK